MGDVICIDFTKKEQPSLLINPGIVIEMYRKSVVNYQEAHRFIFHAVATSDELDLWSEELIRISDDMEREKQEREKQALIEAELIPAWAS